VIKHLCEQSYSKGSFKESYDIFNNVFDFVEVAFVAFITDKMLKKNITRHVRIYFENCNNPISRCLNRLVLSNCVPME
jgi:hypothetical protein